MGDLFLEVSATSEKTTHNRISKKSTNIALELTPRGRNFAVTEGSNQGETYDKLVKMYNEQIVAGSAVTWQEKVVRQTWDASGLPVFTPTEEPLPDKTGRARINLP